MGPCCCACSSCQPLTLAFKGGGELPACRCALAAASPVLRDALSLETKQQGTLVLQSEVDDPAAWEVVLGMIRRDSFACELVTWVSAWDAGYGWQLPCQTASLGGTSASCLARIGR